MAAWKTGAGYLSGSRKEASGVQPENCLVFEDVPAGIMAGKRAGMRVCRRGGCIFHGRMRQKKDGTC
ncbi:MAG: HAD-IA family hydrolase [Clostridium fessum]